MKSSSRRASRAPITCLIIACTLAAGYQAYQWLQRKPTEQAAKPAIAPAVLLKEEPKSDAPSPIPTPLMAVGPTLGPTTMPIAAPLTLTFGPTTRPIAFGAPLQSQSSAQLLGDARTKLTAGELLNARSLLNRALLSGSLSPTEAESTKTTLSDINKSVVFSPKVYAGDTYALAYSVKPGDKLTKIATEHDITWELLCRLNKLDDPRKLRSGRTIKIINGPFHAVVSKSAFKMDLYLGSPGESNATYVTSFSVGLGKDDSTPTGTWQVEPHKKIKNPTYFSPRGEGIIQADDPKNPLGEFWIGLSGVDGAALGKASYGIHGTIEPDTIGRMASMGCIRMSNEDVAQVFELLVEGKSLVVVKE